MNCNRFFFLILCSESFTKCNCNFKEVIALKWPFYLNHKKANYMLYWWTKDFAVLKIFYNRPEEPESSPKPFVMNELLWALNVGSLYF